MQPDATDWKIIDMLSEKHLPNATVAKRLDVSEGTIRQRIKKLQDAGILKIKALRDPNVLENQQLALIACQLNQADQLEQKAGEIIGLANVLSVCVVSGRYDLMIEVLVDSNKGLVTFLTQQLATITGIAKTETFLTLKSYHKWI